MAANENTDINNNMLLAMQMIFWEFLKGQSAFEQEVLQSTTSGNALLCDEQDLRAVDVGCSVPSYVLTTDGAFTKDGASIEPVKHQIPRQQYFVGALNIEVHNC